MTRSCTGRWPWRGAVAAFVVAIVSLAIGAGGVSAAKTTKDCIIPFGSGTLDLNTFYGVAVPIVIPPCNQIASGQRWTVGALWTGNFTFATVPYGFVPAGSTPLQDFLAKFTAVKYVLDPGTDEQKTYLFPNGPKLWVGTSPTGSGIPLVNTLTLGTLPPVSVGQHVVAVYWIFNAMHCDGFGDVISDGAIDDANCLTAGEHLYYAIPFTVMADHQ